MKTTAYIINRSPSTELEFECTQEIWTGKKSEMSHLRVFGCVAYVHVKQDKMQPRALKCIFHGYLEGVKGHRLWYIETAPEKCIIGRDVVFNEQEIPLIKVFETYTTY